MVVEECHSAESGQELLMIGGPVLEHLIYVAVVPSDADHRRPLGLAVRLPCLNQAARDDLPHRVVVDRELQHDSSDYGHDQVLPVLEASCKVALSNEYGKLEETPEDNDRREQSCRRPLRFDIHYEYES